MCTTCAMHNPGKKKEEMGKGKEMKKEGTKKEKKK